MVSQRMVTVFSAVTAIVVLVAAITVIILYSKLTTAEKASYKIYLYVTMGTTIGGVLLAAITVFMSMSAGSEKKTTTTRSF